MLLSYSFVLALVLTVASDRVFAYPNSSVFSNFTNNTASSHGSSTASYSGDTSSVPTTSSSSSYPRKTSSTSTSRGFGSFILAGLGSPSASASFTAVSPASVSPALDSYTPTSFSLSAPNMTASVPTNSTAVKTTVILSAQNTTVSSPTSSTAIKTSSVSVQSSSRYGSSNATYPYGTITASQALSASAPTPTSTAWISGGSCIPGLNWTTLDAWQVESLVLLRQEGTTITACPTSNNTSTVSMYNGTTCPPRSSWDAIHQTQMPMVWHSDDCPCGYTASFVPYPYSMYSCEVQRPATLASDACFYQSIMDYAGMPYANYEDRTLASYCQSPYYCWQQSSIAYSAATLRSAPAAGLFNATSSLIYTSVFPESAVVYPPGQAFNSETTTITYSASTSYSTEYRAMPPCCSSCTLNAATVNVYHWPGMTSNGNLSYASTLVSGNFTFTSPSIYLGFTALQASDMCGAVGTGLLSKTIALNPTDVSTLPPVTTVSWKYSVWMSSYWMTLETWSTTRGPPTMLNSDYFASCTTTATSSAYSDAWISAMIGNVSCQPILQIPSAVWSAEPMWVASGCQNLMGGVFDPPTALTPTTAMAAPTVPPSPAQTISLVAASTTAKQDTSRSQAPMVAASASSLALPQPYSSSPKASSAVTETLSLIQPGAGTAEPVSESSVETMSEYQPPNIQQSATALETAQASSLAPGPSATASALSLIQPGAGPVEPEPTSFASESVPVLVSVIGELSAIATSTAAVPNAGAVIGSVAAQLSQPGDSPAGYSAAASPSSEADPGANLGSIVAEIGPSATAVVTPVDPSVSYDGGAGQPNPQPASSLLIACGSTYSPLPNGGYSINGQTLTTNGAVTVQGTTIQLGPSSAVAIAGGSTQTLGYAAPTPIPTAILTLNGNAYTATTGGVFVIDGTTLTPGQAATVAGQSISLDPSGSAAVVNGATQTLGSLSTDPAQLPIFKLNGKTYTAGSSGVFVIDGLTLLPGQATVLNGQTVSLDSSDSYAVVAGNTQSLQAPLPASAAVFTAGGQIFTAVDEGSSVIVTGSGSRTTVPAGSVVTFAGQTLSVLTSADGVVVDGSSTASLTAASPASAPDLAQATFTDGTRTISAVSTADGVFLVSASSTISVSDGAVTTFQGETISVLNNGGALVLNGTSTVSLAQPSIAPLVVFTHSGQAITAVADGNSVILEDGSSTVTIPDGSYATIQGASISIPTTGGAIVVDGSQTLGLSAPATTPPTTPEAVISASGQHITALADGTSMILVDGSSTITIPDGSATSLGGQTISVPSAGGSVVIDGTSTVALSKAQITTEAIVTVNGQIITAVAQGSSMVLMDGTSRLTVADGAIALFEGQTVSIGSAGGSVVLDGTKTVPLTTMQASTTAVPMVSFTTTGGVSRPRTCSCCGMMAVLLLIALYLVP